MTLVFNASPSLLATVKTTLDLSDSLLQQATSEAAKNGLPLGAFVADAIQAKLATSLDILPKPWMKHFGSLRHLHSESQVIEMIVSDEFRTQRGRNTNPLARPLDCRTGTSTCIAYPEPRHPL